MKSTWRQLDRSEWSMGHWFYELLGVHPVALEQSVPVNRKTDAVRYVPEWQMNRWILAHALAPIAAHHFYVMYAGSNLNRLQIFVFYGVALSATAIRQSILLRNIGHIVGFLDGDQHERDGVPDNGVYKVLRSITGGIGVRIGLMVFLSYCSDQTPEELPWLVLLPEISLYGIVLDFWFYWYHRLMHETDWLWKYHRTHHLTKHPNPLLSLYADLEQEIMDVAGVPILTYATMKAAGFPMGFYEWWICHQYVFFSELAGHSGLRLFNGPPSPVRWILVALGCELLVEDHDLHHRYGWKASGNYGKQTRLWDWAFGTCKVRVECATRDKIDWGNPVSIPAF
ncbi:hypothetical protein PCL_07438 [Purpureocillium lilacinum]|uniref:Fatty acid hydroxylase domain-containing protein n=1 Tax=Purpureocillium lilacinum TaxID=33203 RepID=A0A2U3DRZ6_PURLI|nr:hypothetical protein PCL_07438 [Purpureocillium lilacinum]